METINELLSYGHILKERNEFRKAGTRSGSEFNYFDTPSNTYFKIFFYFNNGDEMGRSDMSGGLLAPTWEKLTNEDYYAHTSAYSYLKMNGEDDRAEKLKQFITLLSNISSYAPWTFKSISGLDGALERDLKEFKVNEERKKISILCSPDTFDQRVGTLLDLYRDIVWSWGTKREMVPSNLRKFDMGIYIFSDPIKTIHQSNAEKSVSLMDGGGSYQTSSKYIEFHNCEFDYNSSKSGYGEMNNEEGKPWEYTIDIYFDDVYEMRYNEFMMRKIGDILEYDINVAAEKIAQEDSTQHMAELEARVNYYQSGGVIENTVKELIGAGQSFLTNKVNNIVLGNLFTASLSTISQQIKGVAKGHVFSTVSALDDYVSGNYKPSTKSRNLGNLFKGI